jgi:hypothetical protein
MKIRIDKTNETFLIEDVLIKLREIEAVIEAIKKQLNKLDMSNYKFELTTITNFSTMFLIELTLNDVDRLITTKKIKPKLVIGVREFIDSNDIIDVELVVVI